MTAGKVVLVVVAAFTSAAWADTVEGRVVEDHSGRPLPSAEVRVLRTGSAGLTADLETDGEGRFQAAEIPSGEYRIEVLKPNYSAATVRLRPGNPAVTVRLVRCAVVSGQVTDQTGQPLRGATVYTMTKPADGGPFQPFANHGPASQVRADDRGRFRIHSLPPGQYAFAVTYGASSAFAGSNGSASPAAGVGSGVLFFPNNARPRSFTVSGGEDFQDVNFMVLPSPLYAVSGKVELPAEKTQFWVALTNVEQTAFAVAVTRAEPTGNFRFEGIPAGSYHLFATGPVRGYGGGGAVLGPDPFYGRSRVEVAGLNVEGLSVAVQKGRSVSFALRAAAQQAQSGCPASAELTLTSLEDWSAILVRTTQLSFAKEQALDNLAPARYAIRMANLGQTCSYAGAVLDLSGAADSKPVAVLLAPAGAIRGRVTGARNPADFAVTLVAADPIDGESALQTAFPDAESRFTFGNLRPGRYYISAQAAGEAQGRWVADIDRMLPVDARGGVATDVELPVPANKP